MESGASALARMLRPRSYKWNRAFDLNVEGTAVPLPLALSFLPNNSSIPTVTGTTDFTAKAAGEFDRPAGLNVNFNGVARNVVVNENAFGEVTFNGTTANQVLNADLIATLEAASEATRGQFGEDRSVPHQTDFPQSRGSSLHSHRSYAASRSAGPAPAALNSAAVSPAGTVTATLYFRRMS